VFSRWEKHLVWICTNSSETCPSGGPVRLGSQSAVATGGLFWRRGRRGHPSPGGGAGGCHCSNPRVFPSRKHACHQTGVGCAGRVSRVTLTYLCVQLQVSYSCSFPRSPGSASSFAHWFASLALRLADELPVKSPLCSCHGQRSCTVFGELHSS